MLSQSALSPSSRSPVRPVRIAIMGGDGRLPSRVRLLLPANVELRHFKAGRYGGGGEARALAQSIRTGGIDRVIVLSRWNGHSATLVIQRLCRRLDVPIQVVK